MAEKFLNYSGTDLLWKRITKLIDKKTMSIKNADDSIQVTANNEIAVKISASANNLLQLKSGEGLYVKAPDKMHTLKFGTNQIFEYDGSKDVIVPIYLGDINE